MGVFDWLLGKSRTAEAPTTSAGWKISRRNYTAGKVDRLTASWTTNAKSIDQIVASELKILRARSREQAASNDYARRFVALSKSNIVGPHGVTFQARIKDPNGIQDGMANDAVEAAWAAWGASRNCDVTGLLNWVEMQHLFIESVVVDGEVLLRKIYGKAAGAHGYALQFLDPELLDVDFNKELGGGSYIKFGIEFNQWGRPQAYHLIDSDPSQSDYAYRARKYMRVPADQIIHAFCVERVGQKRGIPWMATALSRMQMLNGYEDAAITNARIGASKMGFFKSSDGQGYGGDEVDAAGNLITDVAPGTFEQLPSGVELSSWDPAYPNGEFGAFMKSCLRGISAGLGVSYNSLANDLEGVNFSSIRSGVQEDRESWKTLQEWMIGRLHTVVYTDWLRAQLLMQNILVFGKPLNPLREEKYRQVSWQARRWQWVDPLKDIKAQIEAINNGLRSRSDVIREQGRDPDDVWSEIERERKTLDAMGINVSNVYTQEPEIVDDDAE